jgi:hypothetical protein
MSRITVARPSLMVVLAALCLSVVAPATPAAEIDRYGYLARLASQRSLSGQCTVTVKPDEASITVGLDGEGDTPVEARQSMDALRGRIQALVAQHRGRIQEHEMIRMMRSGDPLPAPAVAPGAGPVSVVAPAGKTFVFSQRLDLEFPIAADVDVILLGLNKAGVKRIGRHALTAGYYGRHLPPQPVVFYGFREPDKLAERVHQHCRAQALEKWCQTQAPGDRLRECVTELKRVLDRFPTQNMSLRTTTASSGYPGAGNFHVSYPYQPLAAQHMVLMGREPVELAGSIYLRYTGPSW